jgi:hypothetical protein
MRAPTDRSILEPSAYAEAALEPLRSIRLQFVLALAALGVGSPATSDPRLHRRRTVDARLGKAGLTLLK